VLRPLEIDDLRLGAADQTVRPRVFDIDAVDEHAMQRSVADEQVWCLDPQQFTVDVSDRRGGQTRVQPRQRPMQPVLQDRIAVSGVRALAAIDVERDPGPVPESIAQALQPAERGLFGVRLGEAAAHRLAHRWSDKHTLLRAWRRRAGVLLLGA
jgi:hypothetical protein